jgi:hypothetical protein
MFTCQGRERATLQVEAKRIIIIIIIMTLMCLAGQRRRDDGKSRSGTRPPFQKFWKVSAQVPHNTTIEK